MSDNICSDTVLSVFVLPPSSRQRSPKTTNLERILGDLLDDLLQGYITVQEAHAGYGSPRGRTPRRFPTFADYLTDRIQYAESPAAEQQLRALLFKAAERMSGRAGQNMEARATETKQINRLLFVTGHERAYKLRTLLADLTASEGALA